MRYFLTVLIFFLSCSTRPENIPGCTDSTACNYNSEANEDDGSCAELDCQGNCDGEAYLDPCGYCDVEPQNDCTVVCVDIMAEFSIGEEEFQCENGITEEGYDCNDLTTILNIMYSNPNSLHGGMDADNNKIITVYEYGVQQWSSGRLISLDLDYNENVVIPTSCNFRLTNLPDNIGELSALKKLSLKNNELTSIPESITNLTSLEQLLLGSNNITSLPDDIGNLVNLEVLIINFNQIGHLPVTIGNLVSLEQLWAHYNHLDNLPESIGSMSQLEWLYLNNNSLQSLPESIGNLGSLKKLTVENNLLIDLPESLCNIYDGLDIFSVSDNYICSGSYPICLTEVVISGNQQCVDCPPHYFLIEGYCAYEFDYNILQNFLDLNPESQSLPAQSGIPYEASQCVNEDWWDGGRLVEITFHHKQLTSIIPENLGDLNRLEILRLEGNDLIGKIPDNITNLDNLNILKLNSNNLSGNIPENIGKLSKIDTLYLSYNNFTGEIPPSITEINSLTFLALNDNNFSGSIPEEIGSLDSLRFLYLDKNQLSGKIPQSIGDLTKIRRLYLHTNNLSGLIPDNICTIYSNNENAKLMLDHNQLCPPYPECITESQLGLKEDNISIDQDTTACELR